MGGAGEVNPPEGGPRDGRAAGTPGPGDGRRAGSPGPEVPAAGPGAPAGEAAGDAAGEAAGDAAGEAAGDAAGDAAGLAARLRGMGRVRLASISGAVLAVIVALSVIGATAGAGHAAPRSLGQARPFTLSVLGHPGRHLSLASFSGRAVIVNFFASWCGPCQRETPLIAHFYRASHGHPAIIGIDVNDSAPAAQAFVHRKGVAYPVAVDPQPMKTALAYGLPGLPATFFLNARHQIVKRVFGAVTRADLAAGSELMLPRGK